MNSVQVLILTFCMMSMKFLITNGKAVLQTEGIVGGDVATIDRINYQVSIQFNEKHDCGGAIIGDRHVLTAAHCLLNRENKFDDGVISIVAGVTNALDKTNSAIVVKVEKAYIPIDFQNIFSDFSILECYNVGDIAVLKLRSSLQLITNLSLKYLKLPEKQDTYPSYVNKKPIVSGFGVEGVSCELLADSDIILETITLATNNLKFAETIVISNDQCAFQHEHAIDPKHLCAQIKQRDATQFEGTCIGDSGAPLVLDEETVIGVLSASPIGCDESDQSAIYTRVNSYLTFIHNALNDVKSHEIIEHSYT